MTIFGTTCTGEFFIGIDTELIVIGKLFELLNISDGIYEYFRLVVDDFYFGFTVRLDKINNYIAAMIKVSGHVASESSIYDFSSIDVSPIQSKHVTSKVEDGLPYISRRFTNNLSNVLNHRCVFWVVIHCKQS